MLKVQTWHPEPGVEFDEVFEYLVPGEAGVFIECTRAVLGHVDMPNAAASHLAYKTAHVQGNPAWATFTPAERQAVIDQITPRQAQGNGQGAGQGKAPGG